MTTETAVQQINFVQASNLAMDEALAADPTVFLIGEDIADEEGGGVFKVTLGLSAKYGTDRVRSTPISEQAIMGAAVGAAIAGLRPVAEIMLMNFLTIAGDQLFNHGAKHRYMTGGRMGVPLTVRCSTGAGVGFAAQHSDMLEAWVAHTPGLKVVVPSSPANAMGLLSSCIFDDDPCVFVEDTMLYYGGQSGPAPEPGFRIPLGQAEVVTEGTDVTLVSYGKSMIGARRVAEALAAENISVELIDLLSIAPLDERTVLESVAKTKRAVILHEGVKRFGVGAELGSRIHEELFSELAAPVQRLGGKFTPVPYATTLEQAFLTSDSELEQAIRLTLK